MTEKEKLIHAYNDAMRGVLFARKYAHPSIREEQILNVLSNFLQMFAITSTAIVEIHEEIIEKIKLSNDGQGDSDSKNDT